MKVKCFISIIMSLLLVMIPISNIAYGEGKTITFELYDGKTNDMISETVSFAVYAADSGEVVDFQSKDNNEYKYLLTNGRYELKASADGYYTTNENFELNEHTWERVPLPLYKKSDVVMVTDTAISAEINTSGSSGVNVSVIKDNLPEEIKSNVDEFRVVLIPSHTWNVENDGLPAGFNSNPQEPLENTRHENLDPGDYFLFVCFYNVIQQEPEQGGDYSYLVGYATKNIIVTEIVEGPGGPGEPGEPGGPGWPDCGEEIFNFYYEGEEEPFYTTKECMPNIKIDFKNKSSITIRMEVETEDEELTDFGGWGVLEYVVDRSQYVVHSNVNGPELTVYKNFGKATLHYMYDNHNRHAFITFYEDDFVGINVEPEIGAGDWGTGVIDASGRTNATPTSFVYFLNEEVSIKPSNIGKRFVILGIEGEGITAEFKEQDGHLDEHWRVTLPDIIEPVVRLTLTLKFEDNSTSEVPLEIRRVLLDAFSMEYDEEHKREILESGEEITTPRGTPYEYNGEDYITFVGVFAFEEGYLIDHTLLVMYYENNRILGAKQFEVLIEGEPFRDEIPVYRKGHPDYASVSRANRITAFLISKEGVDEGSNTFGGATFGVGAGWGHLMPNHKDWGSGKDGMDYE